MEVVQRDQRINAGRLHQLFQIHPFVHLMGDMTVPGAHGDDGLGVGLDVHHGGAAAGAVAGAAATGSGISGSPHKRCA